MQFPNWSVIGLMGKLMQNEDSVDVMKELISPSGFYKARAIEGVLCCSPFCLERKSKFDFSV